MNVLIYAESKDRGFKKAINDAVYYGKQVANNTGGKCIAVALGSVDNPSELGQYGADLVIHDGAEKFDAFDSVQHTKALVLAAKDHHCNLVIIADTANGKSIAGRVAINLEAGLVSMVNALPLSYDPLMVSRTVFSGKAIAKYQFQTENKVMTLAGNSIKAEKQDRVAEVQKMSFNVPDAMVKVLAQETVKGEVPLPEAELVVSAGRGMKGPENWGIIEDLAHTLGATTACSRPVADSDWRPHHEHVGQTGVAIRPNLYIAIGISGAIQHLAGVNNSKTIVVINKDPEAPFFKAADYGVVGDLFEVVPRLTEALKKYKSQNS